MKTILLIMGFIAASCIYAADANKLKKYTVTVRTYDRATDVMHYSGFEVSYNDQTTIGDVKLQLEKERNVPLAKQKCIAVWQAEIVPDWYTEDMRRMKVADTDLVKKFAHQMTPLYALHLQIDE